MSLFGFRFYTAHIRDYMRRFIFEHPWGSIRLHHILRSDDERSWHDHPFSFTSILLTNGYTEEYPELSFGGWWTSNFRFYHQFSVVRRKAEDRHRLYLHNGPVWTLVFTGPRIREWGFWDSAGRFTHHSHYEGAVN